MYPVFLLLDSGAAPGQSARGFGANPNAGGTEPTMEEVMTKDVPGRGGDDLRMTSSPSKGLFVMGKVFACLASSAAPRGKSRAWQLQAAS